jgi:hypothetical protein
VETKRAALVASKEARQLPLRPPTDTPPPPACFAFLDGPSCPTTPLRKALRLASGTPATSMYYNLVGSGPWKRNFMELSMSSLPIFFKKIFFFASKQFPN